VFNGKLQDQADKFIINIYGKIYAYQSGEPDIKFEGNTTLW